MCDNKCPTVTYFIALHGSRDQPSAQEFTKYIGKPSPAPRLESTLARSWL